MHRNFQAGTCNSRHHLSRRSLMKGLLTTASGFAVAKWGALTHSQTIAAEAKRSGRRCIMLYMEGGVSQIDTFDMKPGRPTAGPFRPIKTNVNGIEVCEYLPKMALGVAKQLMSGLGLILVAGL